MQTRRVGFPWRIFITAIYAVIFQTHISATATSVPEANGFYPNGLIEGHDGNFYGTTYKGGGSDKGTVFKMTPAGLLTTLVSFNGANGCYPYSALVEDKAGNFYGTTYKGGGSDKGTVFKVTPKGALTTLVSFNGANGSCLEAALLEGRDGNFYGTTRFGGNADCGTIFKVPPTGELATLVSLPKKLFPNTLIQGRDGNFYGTTEIGGKDDNGTVFSLKSGGGELTTLAALAWTNGAHPYAALVQGQDGNFYGTAKGGGGATVDVGTVFKMTPSGELTSLVSMSETNGMSPEVALVEGRDGYFYGTTKTGGTGGCGTVFKLTATGTFTTLVSFNGANGKSPKAALVEGRDGNFYGTTETGGSANLGTVFKMSPAGELVTLVSFSGTTNNIQRAAGTADVAGKGNRLGATDDRTTCTSFRYWGKFDAQGKPITHIEPQRIYGELYYVGVVGFCSYLLNTGDGLLLIDSFFPNKEGLLSKNIEKLGFSSKDVKWIFNTHYHGDHVGGDYEIIKQSKAKIYIHERGIERLDLGFGKGKIPPDCEVVGLKGGETITCGNYKIHVIYTPGHSLDHCCYSVDIPGNYGPGKYGVKKALAIGDASGFWCDVAFQERNGYKGGGQDFRKSISLLKSLKYDFLLAGHPWQIVPETNADGNPFASREEYYRLLDNRYFKADEFLKRHPEYE